MKDWKKELNNILQDYAQSIVLDIRLVEFIEALLSEAKEETKQEILKKAGELKRAIYPSEEVADWEEKSKRLDYYNQALEDITNIIKNI